MKISEQWLRQWVNPNNTSEQLAEQLTMAGLEIDDRFAVARAFSGVVVGEVISVEPHPDADKLRVTQVNIGESEPLQIVCGAPNVTVGMKAPVATVGAVLPSDDVSNGKSGFKIKKSKLRGVASNGMLCGASEIDLVDDIDGLLELPEDAPIGTDIRDYLGLDNQILDISITPNRGDCFSVRGIAREISVINDLPMQQPEIATDVAVTDNDATPAVTVSAIEACPRYLLQSISNIDRSIDTPKWMADALVQSGLRSHNFLVDVTNYVLIELGQPLHAFDADTIQGDIVVRLAQPAETLTLLNEQTITLTGDELVIADDEGVLALAGIMGGKRSSVTDSTTNIILESAFFNPLAIAARARRFGLHTDASQRFERGVDFELPALALARAVDLITSVTSGQAGQIVKVENSEHLPARTPITLPISKVREVVGIEIEPAVMVRILTQLGFEVAQQAESLICTPPSYRFDMSIREDLIEEIARIYGYDNIPSVLPHLQVSMDYDDTADLTHEMKLALVNNGYMEAISFSFSDAKLETLLDDEALGEVLALANPISSDLAVMRRTLLSSLLPCVQYNLNRQQPRVRFFETGLSFVGQSVSDLVQTPSMALVAVGDIWDEQAYQNRALDFYDLKHDIEQLLPAQIDRARVRYERSQLAFLHPGQSAKLYIDDIYVGWLGQLHPSTAKQLDLPATWVAQLSLAPLLNLAREQHDITTPSKFPQVRRDIAILVDTEISLQTLESTVRRAAGALLSDMWLFDVYQGDKVPTGQRSLAFALIWQDLSQTLSDEAVKTATDKVVHALIEQHSVQLRDS
ncbi:MULTISPECIES: phenylalanine--tRNA ligase subunit beta [unclassified Psychrobacter]|uniref:phenylalanine--tRNA ligase subunit beta n=1 Tax=unclassified Psychrobacter TaxID=196806 RepID=UPI0009471475|nr:MULTISPECIES: phenylalanine--tRNA ligase subunit beta [unclassified Psychrobacter]OLF40526.1 phenylalanine--tRNA ligase subunit beta [Psychrobacter sp. Rd 27.2]PJX20855.1 phenylalanine--tRNA ligase subunit beta [Psychrobacter sp. L7]